MRLKRWIKPRSDLLYKSHTCQFSLVGTAGRYEIFIIMEEWKDIPWCEWLYKVSNLWNIKSLKFWRWKNKEIIMKPQNNKWYLSIMLKNSINKKQQKIHRIVLLSFIWFSNLPVNHKNWIKTDNRLCNLEYCTKSENEKHKYNVLNIKPYFKWKIWILNHNSKKTYQYNLEWDLIKIWDSLADINRFHWYNIRNISSCCHWKQKTSMGFIWKYS